MTPSHLAIHAFYAPHQAYLIATYGRARHVPPEGTVAECAALRRADLRGADLTGADLTDADLRGADLRGADLRGADLIDANLSGADLRRVIIDIPIPIVPDLHRRVYEAASQDGALDMDAWHICATTHCRAGWAIRLAGAAGTELEEAVGPSAAGAFIYAGSCPGERVPDFYASNEAALADMRRCAGVEA